MITQFEQTFHSFIEREMTNDAAHDILHVKRVVAMATQLCAEEGAHRDVVLPAAWLHDCFASPKNHPDRHLSSTIAADKAIVFLTNIGYPTHFFDDIHHAIVAHSFSANVAPTTLEAKIVQDADRLDSLGAIGIARTCVVGAKLGGQLYCEDDPLCEQREPDDKAFMLDHFHVKLFKLVDSLNTASAKREGERRTQYMRDFFTQLQTEIA